MHTVMQHLPFRKEGLSHSDVDTFINQLIDKHIIDQDAKKDIRFEDVYQFIES